MRPTSVAASFEKFHRTFFLTFSDGAADDIGCLCSCFLCAHPLLQSEHTDHQSGALGAIDSAALALFEMLRCNSTGCTGDATFPYEVVQATQHLT